MICTCITFKFVTYEDDETSKYRYIVMELLGPSFSEVRRALPSHRFSPSTVLRAGIEMLRAIEEFHKRGILHRDIKPSNFLIRASRRYPLALTDYGLSRMYIDPQTGEPVPPRERPGFVGTGKYASLNAHEGKELGRKDDLISWFYSLMEMWEGRLPWPSSHDKGKVYAVKRQTDIATAIPGMPKPMITAYKLIRRMERDDKPDYKLLTSFMVAAMEECGARWDDPWEWESMDLSGLSAIDLTPPEDETPIIPTDLPPPKMPPREFIPFARDEELGFGNDRRRLRGVPHLR